MIQGMDDGSNLDDLTAENIRTARLNLGWTKKKLGNKLDPPATERTIAHYEDGGFLPPARSLRERQLADVLGLRIPGEPAGTAPRSMPARQDIMRDLLEARTLIDRALARL